jgi:cell division inhibitor SulA
MVEQPPKLPLMVEQLTPPQLQQSSKNSRWQTGKKSAAILGRGYEATIHVGRR